MYAHMLQAVEERLWRKWAKTSNEGVDLSLSTSVPATNGALSSMDPSPTSLSSSLLTTPPSPSSISPIMASANTLKEIPLPPILQNPSPLVASVILSEDMAAKVSITSSSLFSVLSEMSPSISLAEPTIAPSPAMSSTDSDISSISSTLHFPPSFSFTLNISLGEDIPSPAMSWSPPPPLAFVPQGIDTLPSSVSPQMETPPSPTPSSSPLLENLSPSSETLASSSLFPADATLSSPPSSPPSPTLLEWHILPQEELLPRMENMDKTLQLVSMTWDLYFPQFYRIPCLIEALQVMTHYQELRKSLTKYQRNMEQQYAS